MIRITKLPVCALSIAMLASCAYNPPPRSREDLISRQPTATVVCSNLDPVEVEKRLTAAWTQCYDRTAPTYLIPAAGLLIPTGGGRPWRVERQSLDGGFSLFLWNQPQRDRWPFYLMAADIRSTSACKSEVSVRGFEPHHQAGAANTAAWLEQPALSAQAPTFCR